MTPGELFTIGISSGTVSALLNLAVTELRERTRSKRDMEHQALQVAEHLEAYAFACATYAFGNWRLLVEGRPGALVSRVPDFGKFPDTITWQSLDASHATEMRALPGRVLSAVIAVDAGFGRSAYDGFRTAQYWTLALGSEAFKNAAYLREISRINQLSFDQPTWDYPTFLRGELEKHEVRKQEIAALLHNNPAGHWPPAQPIEG